MKHILFYLGFLAILLTSMTSCKTHEKLVYFQDGVSANDSSKVSTGNYIPTFKKDDLLSIVVTGDDPETAIPFNLPTVLTSGVSNSGYTTGNPERMGYLIDKNGAVNMPFLGAVKLSGLSREEAIALIEKQLSVYVNHPIVNIQILNYKITVLGDVARPGTFKVPNERITLLEAVGLAGDLKITGNRKNVLVIRDTDGVKEEFRIDLTSAALFSSPVYYLEQNDMVYVEPNGTARSRSSLFVVSSSIFISLTSLIITTVSIITK
jgi:polysaccharide export outer membrane protein